LIHREGDRFQYDQQAFESADRPNRPTGRGSWAATNRLAFLALPTPRQPLDNAENSNFAGGTCAAIHIQDFTPMPAQTARTGSSPPTPAEMHAELAWVPRITLKKRRPESPPFENSVIEVKRKRRRNGGWAKLKDRTGPAWAGCEFSWTEDFIHQKELRQTEGSSLPPNFRRT